MVCQIHTGLDGIEVSLDHCFSAEYRIGNTTGYAERGADAKQADPICGYHESYACGLERRVIGARSIEAVGDCG